MNPRATESLFIRATGTVALPVGISHTYSTLWLPQMKETFKLVFARHCNDKEDKRDSHENREFLVLMIP
jgi:hypothetical protein